MLLWAIVMPMTANAQLADSVRWEHEQKLKEVVVTGVTGTTALKNTPAPMSVVTNDELTHTAATNIIDAIAQQPGVAQITTGGGVSKPVVRGLGYNRVVVVNDGIRQEGQQWGDEHGVEIDAQAIGSVEILKGPASLMYGSDALAGVLVMHSHPLPPSGTIVGSATTEGHSNNGLFAYSVSVGGNHGGFVWNSRWSQKIAHSYKDGNGDYVLGTQFREQAFTQLLGLNKRWGYAHATLSYYHLTPSIAEGTTDGSGTAYGRIAPYQQIHHYKAVVDNTFFVGEGNVKATVGYQQNRRQEFEEADACGLDFRLHTVNYDLRYTAPFNDNGWKLSVGANGMYQRSINEGTEFLVPAYRLLDCGLFATVSMDLERWHFSGGVRYDHRSLTSFALDEDGEERFSRFSRHFIGLTGCVGAVYNASDRLNLRLNIARGFRAPNISELGSNGEHEGTGRYEIGNHYLAAETSLQADFGIDYSLPWLFAQASLFANRISNYIFLERLAAQAQGQSTYRFSAGDARLLGGELLIDIHPMDCLHFENTLSYVDARQLDKTGGERYLPFTPAPRWTSNLRMDISKKPRTFVSVGIDHYMKQSHAHTANGTETPTPAYTLLNASAGTDISANGRTIAKLALTASNLLNCTYQSHLSRLKYITDGGLNNMGRNVGIRLTIPLTMRMNGTI